MTDNGKPEDGIDWELTTWDGSRRETLRRWAALPLERVVAALEEMQTLAQTLSLPADPRLAPGASAVDTAVHEQARGYGVVPDARTRTDTKKEK